VLRIRDLILTSGDVNLRDIMIPEPVRVRVDASLEELQATFERRAWFGLPVVDDAGVIVGVVRRASVEAALARKGNRLFLKFSGIIGGEEFRSMPTRERVRRRLSWLSINILLNLVAASVIAYYQDTLAAAIALAVFLPMISDMSGCSGNQAVAVSIRELSLGLVRPSEIARVMGKEIGVGLLNGLALGLLLGGAALLWKGNLFLGLVVGVALAANTVVSVCMGGLLPLVLKRVRLDPALVSSPMLTTVTDMCGFFLVLSLATVFLDRL
jgi:magnesium transporter